jgi:hypothetical protein
MGEEVHAANLHGLPRFANRLRESAGGTGTVTMLSLPFVAELRDGLCLAFGDEDGVVAEALFTALLLGNPARKRPGSAELLALR